MTSSEQTEPHLFWSKYPSPSDSESLEGKDIQPEQMRKLFVYVY